VIRTRNAIGRLEFERGNLAAAESMLEEALTLYQTGDDATHPFAAEASTWLGRVRLAQGNAADAAALLEQAVELGQAQQSPQHVDNVRRRLWLAEARVAGDDAAAESDLRRARDELARIESAWADALADNPVPPLETLLNGNGAGTDG
jgi:tetratricopeptide (TPR) repeat protein